MPSAIRRLSCAPLAALVLLAPVAASAQPPGTPAPPGTAPIPTPAPPQEPGTESPDSPRASVRRFLELTDTKGDFRGAARYLTLPPGEEERGPELARRLSAVLDRYLDVDLETLSPSGEGDTEDDLPAGVDKLGEVADGRRERNPVFLVRSRDADGAYWAFSRQTVARVDKWYDALPDRWIRDRIPKSLQLRGPADLMWWQWLAVPFLVGLALALGRLLGMATRACLFRLTRRTETQWAERLLAKVSTTLTVLWGVAAAALLLPWLALLPPAERVATALLSGIATVAVFWGLWRSVDVAAHFVASRPEVVDNPSAKSLLALMRNVSKALVAMGGVLGTMAVFGYPVTTALAGLGIGGIALAFGAQKTVENLFGSLALAMDQPFRLGDFVRIDDFVGHVEKIGMRSTQVRTLDRTLVSIPNGKLADMRIEDFAARDRIRLTCTVGVVYGTTQAQIERILAGMEKVLRDHPRIWPDTVVVRFAGFGASSLDIEVMAWFLTTDFNEFRECRQAALLGFMRVVEEEGSSFAFPTRTVHLVTEPGGAGGDDPTPPA
jgi:MscS family membrane protein